VTILPCDQITVDQITVTKLPCSGAARRGGGEGEASPMGVRKDR